MAGLLLMLLGSWSPVVAKSGSRASEDAYRSEHIGGLPAEVRKAVVDMCGASARGAHYFAIYRQSPRTLTLHFEHSRCGGMDVCTNAGCLHQVFGLVGGRYRLLRSYRSLDSD
jgi:hypothetical protein